MDFYSYLSEESSGAIAYLFQTKTDTRYRVFFYPVADYNQYFENCPYTLQHGYIFGIAKGDPHEDKKEPFDKCIKNTVEKVVIDFFESYGNTSFLIYNYESYDEKQRKRSLCFDRWYNSSDYSSKLEKVETVIESPNKDGEISIDYIGLIIMKDNVYIEQAMAEFHTAKELLVSSK